MIVLPKPLVPGSILAASPYQSGDIVWRSPGVTNLLTTNQASVEDGVTTGFAATTNCAIAATSTAGTFATGSWGLSVTSSASGAVVAGTPVTAAGSPAVTAGRVYSAVFSAKSAAITSSLTPRIRWWTAAGSAVSTTSGTAIAVSTSAFTEYRVTAAAPATAAYATLEVTWTAVGASEVVYLDRLGLWEGPGGTWAMPGEPIQGIGTYWDETVGRRQFAWDTVNARWQMVYGDTGWRDLAASLSNSWAATSFNVRRVNSTVYVRPVGLSGAGASADTIITVDAGFRPTSDLNVMVPANVTDNTTVRAKLTSTGVLTMPRGSVTACAGQVSFSTTATWPTSLPGTASGTIPYA